jgi:hypothetical protein
VALAASLPSVGRGVCAHQPTDHYQSLSSSLQIAGRNPPEPLLHPDRTRKFDAGSKASNPEQATQYAWLSGTSLSACSGFTAFSDHRSAEDGRKLANHRRWVTMAMMSSPNRGRLLFFLMTLIVRAILGALIADYSRHARQAAKKSSYEQERCPLDQPWEDLHNDCRL